MGKILLAAGWIVTTVAAAVIGWMSTSFLDQGRPQIVISDIRPSQTANASLVDFDQTALDVDQSFLDELSGNVWLNSFDPKQDSIAYITDTLKKDREQAQDLVRTMSAFRARFPEMEALTQSQSTASNSERFFDIWADMGDYIYDTLIGTMKRGTFPGPDPKDYKDRTPFLLTYYKSADNKKTLCNHERGGLFSSCLSLLNDEIDEGKLREIGLALSYFDQDALEKYIQQVKQDADRVQEIEKIRQDLEIYTAGFSRWTISALITNAGSRAISITPEAFLYVNTENAAGFAANDSVPLVVQTKDGGSEPTTVGSGETKLITFTSRSLILTSPRWRFLLDLFKSSSRNCFLAVHLEGDPWSPSTPATSRVRVFGVPSGGDIVRPDEVRRRFVSGS